MTLCGPFTAWARKAAGSTNPAALARRFNQMLVVLTGPSRPGPRQRLPLHPAFAFRSPRRTYAPHSLKSNGVDGDRLLAVYDCFSPKYARYLRPAPESIAAAKAAWARALGERRVNADAPIGERGKSGAEDLLPMDVRPGQDSAGAQGCTSARIVGRRRRPR